MNRPWESNSKLQTQVSMSNSQQYNICRHKIDKSRYLMMQNGSVKRSLLSWIFNIKNFNGRCTCETSRSASSCRSNFVEMAATEVMLTSWGGAEIT